MSAHRLTVTPTSLKHAAYAIKALQPYTLALSPIRRQRDFGRGDTSQPLTATLPSALQKKRDTVMTFRGLVIPEVPKAPQPDGMSLISLPLPSFSYPHRMLHTNIITSVAAVRASLSAMNVPVDEWPETIRPRSEKRTPLAASSISMNAFQEMERALEARREAQAQS
ncbi:hypothetical protein F5148DRAFT_1199604 [Russula earlei]|uniref:Uncharacterized protein n=1 Tax=Russula earlei TaxID=71964 RepID=A0ACC0U8S2_9AGAM|nr:hypothetical protein F5148DRAFT_1199604 [Russula earlei]